MTRVLGLLLAALTFAAVTAIFVMSFNRPWLGVDVRLREGTWVVGYVDPVGLAYEAGVKPGTKVTSINDKPVEQFAEGARYISWRQARHITVVTDRGTELRISTRGARLSRANLWELLRLWLVSIVFWAAGAFTVARRQQTGAALALFLFCQAVALFLATVPGTARDMLGTRALAVVTVALIPALFVHFFLLFPERKRTWESLHRLYAVPYIPAVLLLSVYVLGARHNEEFFILQFRPLLLLNLGVGSLIGAGIMVHSYMNAVTLRARQQVRVVAAATVVAVLLFSVLSALPEVVFERTIVASGLSVLAASFIPIGLVSSAVGRELMGIDLHIRRGLIYGV